jgi:CTP:molybdopterin cytidylyltransferase MocA
MSGVTVLMFQASPNVGESELIERLAAVRSELTRRQALIFQEAGAEHGHFVAEWQAGLSFGEVLAERAPSKGGLIVLSAGSVPLLKPADARRLVKAASSRKRAALTNNRYSSDIIAVARASVLRHLPDLPSDNALPRWLEEHAGYEVAELPGRDRLALDIDTPLDVALVALASGAPGWLARAASEAGWAAPRRDELRTLAADPHAELLVFGRSSSRTLRWMERNLRCRVRFLAEERGLRASSPLAIGRSASSTPTRAKARQPRATLGMLLDARGPGALAEVVSELADGAIIDTRVLLAHRLGANEADWPSAVDRYASDLLQADEISDPWLRELTKAAASSEHPILLGSHSLVGPGIPLVLARKSVR